MLINQLYNPNHKLANTSLAIRGIYVLPTFILVFFSTSIAFCCTVFALFLILNRLIIKTTFRNLFQLYSYPLIFTFIGSLTLALSVKSPSPLFVYKTWAFGFDGVYKIKALLVFSRSLSILSLVFFYMMSHSISEIVEVMRFFKVPRLLIELIVLSYKFILNLLCAGRTMLVAQKCRMAYADKGNSFYAFALLMSAVFRKGLAQTSQMEVAISARLGDGGFDFVSPQKCFSQKQLVVPLLLSVILLALFLIFEIYA